MNRLKRKAMAYGKLFGYPQCCVTSWVKGNISLGGVFEGTGYVPCKRHRKMKPEDVLAEILSKRKSPYTFPYSHDVEYNLSINKSLTSELTEILETLHGVDVTTMASNPNTGKALDPKIVERNKQIMLIAAVLAEYMNDDLVRLMVRAKLILSKYEKENPSKEKITLEEFVIEKFVS